MKLAVILESHGDYQAIPCLIARIAQKIGSQIYASNPVKCGGIHRLQREGELERYLRMAASQPQVDAILVAVDLDDGCAVATSKLFQDRVDAMRPSLGIPVRFCFLVREYEAWFLEDLANLSVAAPEYDWIQKAPIEDSTSIRDAKSALNARMRKHYKETTDQLNLTRKIAVDYLYANSRTFRKFAKAMTGCEYDELAMCFCV